MLEEALLSVKKYRKVFEIDDDIKITVKSIPQGHELVYDPVNRTVELWLDKDSISDIPELLAQVKLGLEYHPLLATMYFQSDASEEETRLAGQFYTLVIPVIDAWVWKIMQKYMSADEFEMEVDELLEMIENLEIIKMYTGGKIENERARRRLTIGIHLIIKAVGGKSKLKLVGDDEKKKKWIEYVKDLENLVMQEPSIDALIELGRKYGFNVKVVQDERTGYYVDIRKAQ